MLFRDKIRRLREEKQMLQSRFAAASEIEKNRIPIRGYCNVWMKFDF